MCLFLVNSVSLSHVTKLKPRFFGPSCRLTLKSTVICESMQIQNNEKAWRAWFDKDAPEEETIPDGYTHTLDTFRKLLLIRSVTVQDKLSGAT